MIKMEGCYTGFEKLNNDYTKEHIDLRIKIGKKLKLANPVPFMYDSTRFSLEELREIFKCPHEYYPKSVLEELEKNFVLPSQR